MNESLIYLQLGFEHITDIKAFDHILFLIALCAIYIFKQWKEILILVTAFTLGHSITLALSSLHFIQIDSDLIELLIPITILLTCLTNFFHKFSKKNSKSQKTQRYILACFFGLIHGLGFSNYLKSLLGQESNILTPLFSFNLGLELGQLIIVFIFLSLNFITLDLWRVKRKFWNLILSGIVFGMALMMMINAHNV